MIKHACTKFNANRKKNNTTEKNNQNKVLQNLLQKAINKSTQIYKKSYRNNNFLQGFSVDKLRHKIKKLHTSDTFESYT